MFILRFGPHRLLAYLGLYAAGVLLVSLLAMLALAFDF